MNCRNLKPVMENYKLTKNQKSILKQLAIYKYPAPVPQKDLKDFLTLENYGLVNHLKLDQESSDLYGPVIAEAGKRYLVINPSLKNHKRKVDWKWLVGIIVALLGVAATIWAK